jgi:hypothetical protein
MHKLSFIIGFMGLCVVTQAALAAPPGPAGKMSANQLEAFCKEIGGTFVETRTSYYCSYPGGYIECLWSNLECIMEKKQAKRGSPDRNAIKFPGSGPTRGDGRKVAGGTITGLGSTTNFGGTATGTRGGAATGANMGGGVMFGSSMPAGTKGGAGSVTAVAPVTSNPALLSTGGALGSTRTGLGAGPIAGSINGRKVQ